MQYVLYAFAGVYATFQEKFQLGDILLFDNDN